MMYVLAEDVRSWLEEHNIKGSDESMHSEMIRKEKEKEKEQKRKAWEDEHKARQMRTDEENVALDLEEEGPNPYGEEEDEFDGTTNFLGAVKQRSGEPRRRGPRQRGDAGPNVRIDRLPY